MLDMDTLPASFEHLNPDLREPPPTIEDESIIQNGNKRPVMLITLSCVRHAFSPPARRSGTTTNWRALRYGWLTLTGVMLGGSPAIVRGQNSAGASTTAGVISSVTITQDTQRVAIRVEGAGHLDVHAERIQNPERLALDFSGARLKVQRTSIPGVSAPVRGVRMGQLRPDVARVVVDLTASVPYQIAHEGDAVVVYLQVQPPDTNAAPTVASAAGEKPPPSKSSSPKWTEAHKKTLLAKAQQGESVAQMWLATAYAQGWFGTTDFKEALRWYRRAAEQGDPDAQNALGRMYEHGEGVVQNFALATKWYKLAAEHVPDYGAAGQGRNNLGMLYLEGHGVSKDYVQAYIWFRLSGLEANPNLSEAKAHMNPEQILEAERLVEAWKSQHTKPQ